MNTMVRTQTFFKVLHFTLPPIITVMLHFRSHKPDHLAPQSWFVFSTHPEQLWGTPNLLFDGILCQERK